jgi:hypothetical protein
MIRKSGNRFSEKIMLEQRDEIMMRFHLIASWSRRWALAGSNLHDMVCPAVKS